MVRLDYEKVDFTGIEELLNIYYTIFCFLLDIE